MSRPTTRQARRLVTIAALTGLSMGLVLNSAVASPLRGDRLAGADRYETAVALRNIGYYDTVYLVTGGNFPDGLAAGAVAGQLGGSVLLTTKDRVPPSTAELISYARKIVVVGDEGVISAKVWTWLQENTKASITRIAGSDRFDTAAKLSAEAKRGDGSALFTPGLREVLIATGADYPDALTGGAAAAKIDSPLLLTGRDSLPAATLAELKRLAPQKITVVGGAGSVSDAVLTQLNTVAPTGRIAGADRYQTARRLNEAYFPAGAPMAVVTTGTGYADALAASAKAGREGGPLLLSDPLCMPQDTNVAIEQTDAEIVWIAGGEQTLTEDVALRTACQAPGTAPKTYLHSLTRETGNAKALQAHPFLGGSVFPRTLTYDTDQRNSDYATWNIGGNFARFTTTVGLGDGVTSALVSDVQVWGDDRLLWSGQVKAGVNLPVDVAVRGVHHLKLTTTTRGGLNPDTGNQDVSANYVYFGDAAVN